MGNKIIRSIRGEEVNFDLNQYKNEMGAVPETETVRYRENLIQTRRKRKNSLILKKFLEMGLKKNIVVILIQFLI